MSSCRTKFIFTIIFSIFKSGNRGIEWLGDFSKVTVWIWNQAVLAPVSVCTCHGYKYSLLGVRRFLESRKDIWHAELIPTSGPCTGCSLCPACPSPHLCLTGSFSSFRAQLICTSWKCFPWLSSGSRLPHTTPQTSPHHASVTPSHFLVLVPSECFPDPEITPFLYVLSLPLTRM